MDDKQFLWDQFARLGEMMGDGLHYEPDGRWIAKEYKKLTKILLPETEEEKAYKKEVRAKKNIALNKQVSDRLVTTKCPSCTGELKQTRSGSRVVKCTVCGKKFEFKKKK